MRTDSRRDDFTQVLTVLFFGSFLVFLVVVLWGALTEVPNPDDYTRDERLVECAYEADNRAEAFACIP